MRFYALLNFQHIMIYLFPTLVFIILLGLFLGQTHFITRHSERRKAEICYRFPDGIEDRDAPFPVAMALVIAGAVVWGFFYILSIGIFEVII
ncbi:MAG: hypothetical protein DSY90_01355 [Deltaproteobacteria bacterium]|nr:MAG: hypothetical protein DSY90_01355 [Deltaproteobacteria bacterium]RTZ99702.1 MAG: hypothetical protein DSY89_07880 [Deltaproteobacteria bacterium]